MAFKDVPGTRVARPQPGPGGGYGIERQEGRAKERSVLAGMVFLMAQEARICLAWIRDGAGSTGSKNDDVADGKGAGNGQPPPVTGREQQAMRTGNHPQPRRAGEQES